MAKKNIHSTLPSVCYHTFRRLSIIVKSVIGMLRLHDYTGFSDPPSPQNIQAFRRSLPSAGKGRPSEQHCKSYGKKDSSGQTVQPRAEDGREVLLRDGDVEVVVKSLGLGGFRRYKGVRWSPVDGVVELLEEMEAAEEEVVAAFKVFDRNDDGFIDAEELHLVMCILEMREGARLEDCRRMIEAFDADGDGRVDYRDFKKMLENE